MPGRPARSPQDVPIEPSFSPSPAPHGDRPPLAFGGGPSPEEGAGRDPALIMRAGPSALMGVSSLFMGMSAVSRLTGGRPHTLDCPRHRDGALHVLGHGAVARGVEALRERRAGQAERLRRRPPKDYLAHLEWELGQGRQRRGCPGENRISLHACLELAYSASPQLFGRP